MKAKVHPPYQEVLFVDSSTGTTFLIGTTLHTKEKETFEGKEYPVCRVPISSSSQPFFTKSKQFVDLDLTKNEFDLLLHLVDRARVGRGLLFYAFYTVFAFSYVGLVLRETLLVVLDFDLYWGLFRRSGAQLIEGCC